jgi:hypothetical protein
VLRHSVGRRRRSVATRGASLLESRGSRRAQPSGGARTIEAGRARGRQCEGPYEKALRRTHPSGVVSATASERVRSRGARRRSRSAAWADRCMSRGDLRVACVGSSGSVSCSRRALRCGSRVDWPECVSHGSLFGGGQRVGQPARRHTTHGRVPVPRCPQGSRGQVRRRVSQADGCGHTLKWRPRTREADSRRSRRGSSR